MKLVLGLFLFVFGYNSVAADATQLASVLNQAKAEKKAVMLHFTDTNVWSRKLVIEVLNKPEFEKFEQANLIRVDVDLTPTNSGSRSLAQLNGRLAGKYEVEDLPSVVLIDADQKLIGKTGYTPGGPKPMVTELTRMLARKQRAAVEKPVATNGRDPFASPQRTPANAASGADHFQLKLTAVATKPPIATINSHTLGPGESMTVKTAKGNKIKVVCKEVHDDLAVVQVEGEPRPVELLLGKTREF